MPRRQMNRASLSTATTIQSFALGKPASFEIERARAEIARLKKELTQAREDLENLTAATSDFVRLMV